MNGTQRAAHTIGHVIGYLIAGILLGAARAAGRRAEGRSVIVAEMPDGTVRYVEDPFPSHLP
jgi:hypothetical protein